VRYNHSPIMLKRIATFIGWGLSSLLFLIGITSFITKPLTAITMVLWGFLVFPPLYKATVKFGSIWNIAARVVAFLVIPLVIVSRKERQIPSPISQVRPSSVVELESKQKDQPRRDVIDNKPEIDSSAKTMTVNGKTIDLGCPIGLGTIFKYQGKTYRVNGVSMGMSDAGMYGKKLNDPSEIGLGDVSEINPAAMKLCKK
jgi:hypothetical protein